MGYIDLHAHGSYSHDGYGSSLQAAQYAKSIGQTALARTEHGNMMSGVELELACTQVGIKPIHGCEIYYQPSFVTSVKSSKKYNIPGYKTKRYHLTILCATNQGYRNLSSMLTIANRDTFYYFPIVEHSNLIHHKTGLIVLSGCMSSYLSQSILSLDEYTSKSYIEEMVNQFGNNFYLETQPISVTSESGDLQKFLNDTVLDYADRYGIPVVATTDAHYPSSNDYDTFFMAHQLRAQTDPINDYSQRYLHSEDEMIQSWQDTQGYDGSYFIHESLAIANRCNVTIKRDIQMPDLNFTNDPDGYLHDLCYARLTTLHDIDMTLYTQRLEEELHTFKVTKSSAYMLLGYDIADYCTCNDILMAARGSACGSLVAYLLRISKIDPIKYGTSFERFYSERRTTVADIDYDIEDERRDEVIDYLERQYPGRTAQICSINRWQTRNLMKDLAKHYLVGAIERECAVKCLEEIGYDENPLDTKTLLIYPVLKNLETSYPGILDSFVNLHGLMTHMGQHACGLVISKDPITDMMPLVRQTRTKKLLTSFSMKEVEHVGGLKVDLLGVSALRAIREAERIAGIHFQESDLENPDIYKHFQKGDTNGIFQYGSRQAKDMARKAQPQDLYAIAALTAINRPVPLAEGAFDLYLKGRNGKVTPSLLSPYTQETFGALVYQEQVMSLLEGLAGFNRSQIDKVLKMLKKYTQDNTELHVAFIDGCQQNGIKYEQAEPLWQNLRRYLFCKAHAVSYAYIAVRQMNIRVKSPYAWTLSLLRQEKDSKKQLDYCSQAIQTIPANRVYFLPAHVNGEINFHGVPQPNGKHFIRFGLSSIDGIGPTAADEIVSKAPYTSQDDFNARINKRIVNVARMQTLIDSGALEFDPVVLRPKVKELNQALMNRKAW